MAKGTVKKVRIEGYGFIATQDTPDSKDIFFHKNNLRGDLANRGLFEGDKVTFNIAKTDKGLSAMDIKLMEDEESAPVVSAESSTEEESSTESDAASIETEEKAA